MMKLEMQRSHKMGVCKEESWDALVQSCVGKQTEHRNVFKIDRNITVMTQTFSILISRSIFIDNHAWRLQNKLHLTTLKSSIFTFQNKYWSLTAPFTTLNHCRTLCSKRFQYSAIWNTYLTSHRSLETSFSTFTSRTLKCSLMLKM